MIRVEVATLVRDRIHHVILCTEWLHGSPDVEGFEFDFVAFDDNSSSVVLKEFLKACYDRVVNVKNSQDEDRSSRIGVVRKTIVDEFLSNSDHDFLLLLDSDIIVTKKTIAEGISDYNELDKFKNLGGGTLYPLRHIKIKFLHNNKMFGAMDLTGDAHMIFRRDHLARVGNHFGPGEGGFADTQIKAI